MKCLTAGCRFEDSRLEAEDLREDKLDLKKVDEVHCDPSCNHLEAEHHQRDLCRDIRIKKWAGMVKGVRVEQ